MGRRQEARALAQEGGLAVPMRQEPETGRPDLSEEEAVKVRDGLNGSPPSPTPWPPRTRRGLRSKNVFPVGEASGCAHGCCCHLAGLRPGGGAAERAHFVHKELALRPGGAEDIPRAHDKHFHYSNRQDLLHLQQMRV